MMACFQIAECRFNFCKGTKKIGNTKQKTDKENRKDITNALFDVHFTEADSNKHFLLVDDVMTSGATLEACAKALLKIPNSKVSIVTIAYTQS